MQEHENGRRESPWTPEQNQARSAALKGRMLPLDVRAKFHATHLTGEEQGHPAWEEAYQQRLSVLQRQQRLVELLRQTDGIPGEVPDVTTHTRFGRLMKAATVIDPDRLADGIERRVLSPKTLEQLEGWLAAEYGLAEDPTEV